MPSARTLHYGPADRAQRRDDCAEVRTPHARFVVALSATARLGAFDFEGERELELELPVRVFEDLVRDHPQDPALDATELHFGLRCEGDCRTKIIAPERNIPKDEVLTVLHDVALVHPRDEGQRVLGLHHQAVPDVVTGEHRGLRIGPVVDKNGVAEFDHRIPILPLKLGQRSMHVSVTKRSDLSLRDSSGAPARLDGWVWV